MKRSLISILCGILIVSTLTGCGSTDKTMEDKKDENSKITCTKIDKDENAEQTETGIIIYNGDKVLSLERTSVSKILDDEITEKEIDSLIEELKELGDTYKGIEGYTFEINKLSPKEMMIKLKMDYEKIDLDKVKEKLGEEYLNDNFPNGKDITVDELKKNAFEGFDCK